MDAKCDRILANQIVIMEALSVLLKGVVSYFELDAPVVDDAGRELRAAIKKTDKMLEYY